MVTQSSFKELQAKFKEGTLSSSRYKKISGVWFYKGRILLDPNSELCKTIFHDHHEAPGDGHSEYHRTTRKIKLSFWWPGIKNFIQQAIKKCDVCQRNKGESVAPPSLLSPLLFPEGVEISIDFVEGLPMS